MRDFQFEQLYTEQIRGYFEPTINEQQIPPAPRAPGSNNQTSQKIPSAPRPPDTPNNNSSVNLEQARQVVAEALNEFVKKLVEKQIGNQDWAQQVFQELGKTMSNKLQDKFGSAPNSDGPPQPQAQPTQPTNPQPQATAKNQ